MSHLRTGLRPALGLFIIAHALAHSVLPMRGLMNPEMLNRDFVPVVLYGVAVIGYAIAGLGVLGVKPLAGAARPLMVVASAYSLVALWRMGHEDLWWGALIDVVLFLVGVTGIYNRLPQRRTERSRASRSIATAAAIAFLVYAASAAVLWPLYRAWGSSEAEYALTLPGDGPSRNPAFEIQHAVTVNAPPEAVWPWLMQLGQDRGGFYSYDWLERAFGVDIHNVTAIRPEWQARKVGELVRATQPEYLGGLLGPELGWTITDLQPGRALVLEHWGAFVLVPAGEDTTRFIIRTRIGHDRTPVWAAALDLMTFQLPHFIMERRMMLQIKALAEAG